MSKSWTAFFPLLFFFVILYILALNGFITYKSDIIENYYFMGLNTNSTKSGLPKPVYVPIQKDIVPQNESKEPNNNKNSLTIAERVKSRPRNTTDYEKGHNDLCKNSWQEGYTKLHAHMLETNQNKFIIFKCPQSGWGNRLRDLISSFHFAVISKRTFILNCETPSSLDKYLAPRYIKWNYKVNETQFTVRRRAYQVKLNDIKDPSDPKIFDKMLNYSVEYCPVLSGNKYQFFADYLKYDLPVWPNLPQMMGCSFYYLFVKSDMLQQRLDEWKEKLGYNENIVIAMHVRLGDAVLRHTRGDDRTQTKEVDFSFDCAFQIQKEVEKKYNTNKIIWFLAADSEKIKSYAKEKHGDKVKYITGPIEHIGHPTKTNGDAGHLSMFLDYFLLQDADYRLYTTASSFDAAVDFITLGTKNAGTSLYRRKRHCVIPQSLKN